MHIDSWYKRIQRYSVLGIGDKEWYKVIRDAIALWVTYVTRVLQMMKVSRKVSRFEDTIEYVIFSQTSVIT